MKTACVLYAALGCVILSTLTLSCSKENGDAIEPEETPEEQNEVKLYVSGVCFKDDCLWQNTSPDAEEASVLFLLEDDEPTVRIDVGGKAGAQTAWDRHGIVRGHLWDCRWEEGRTLLYIDGNEMFAWDGEEYPASVRMEDEGIYTLGSGQGGKGCILRLDGECVFRNDTATPASQLGKCGGNLWFAFAQDGRPAAWYLWIGSETVPLPRCPSDGSIFGVMVAEHETAYVWNDGSSWYIQNLEPGKWKEGARRRVGNVEDYPRFYPLAILEVGGKVVLEVKRDDAGGRTDYLRYTIGEGVVRKEPFFSHWASTSDGDQIRTVGTELRSGKTKILREKSSWTLRPEFRPLNRDAMALHDGIFCLSLKDSLGRAALWKDGEILLYDINGYLDHISFYPN